jgi:hypothetical protein
MHAEREEIGVPGDKSISRSGDGYRKDLIVITIRADAWNLNRRHYFGDRLKLRSHRCSPIARPATGLNEHGLELAQDRGTDDQGVITTEDVVEETSRASTKVERRHQHIGVENDPHSARVIKRDVTYHAESIAEAWESRKKWGAPAWEVEGWITSYVAVATGEMDVVSDAVETITGRPAQDLEAFLSANPALWEKLL